MTSEEWILKVVSSFYEKAKNDILIGYHFRHIKNFEEHIPRIAAFWEMQLLGKTRREYGEPFDITGVHAQLGIKKGELGRWLLLFRTTLKDCEDHPLKASWEERLKLFEGLFLRFLGL
jgi:truncated hemoglobin YjbI